MAPRRSASNNLSPPEATTPSPSSPGSFLNTPRSSSPSGGFTQIFTKPTKWFNRSTSGGGGRPSVSSSEPRSSMSSTRKHKISHPTDPRPIMDNLVLPNGGLGMHAASRCNESLAPSLLDAASYFPCAHISSEFWVCSDDPARRCSIAHRRCLLGP
ncbi:hypothetical protein C8Q80DRAFT_510559 [Daedaleopsis nitida]|nr:hypothetical protein C8Q80DRAFT_510559 [Daedaleopsis nitida]